jgi:maltose O-acetyltransferase
MLARLLRKAAFLAFQAPRIIKYRLLSRRGVCSRWPVLRQPMLVNGQGSVQFGRGTVVGVIDSPGCYSTYAYLDARRPGSRISIGEDTVINNGATIIANEGLISIGRRCLIGFSLNVINCDFHGLGVSERNLEPPSKDVSIDDNVFLGSNVTILKGVKIGENSVIASGSVVVKDIPPNAIAAGNPCVVIGTVNRVDS